MSKLTAETNIMHGGADWPPDDLTTRQYEVLCIIADYACECWGEVFSHVDGWPGSSLQTQLRFNAVASALVRKGAICNEDPIEISAWGRQILNARASGKGQP